MTEEEDDLISKTGDENNLQLFPFLEKVVPGLLCTDVVRFRRQPPLMYQYQLSLHNLVNRVLP